MSGSHEELSQSAITPEIEALRNACPQHGDYYADQLEAQVKLSNLMDPNMTDDDLLAIVEGDPQLSSAHARFDVLQRFADAIALPQQGPKRLLAQGKASLINPYVEQLSDQFVATLGEAPDYLDVEKSMLLFASQAICTNRELDRPAQGKFLTAVVNQFANTMLAKSDMSKHCNSLFRGDQKEFFEKTRAKITRMVDDIAAMTGHHLPEDYFLAKLAAMRQTAYGISKIDEAKKAMPEVTASDAEIREAGRQNTAFAKQIQRIRAYGVKSIIFPFEDVVPGMDATYHTPRMFGFDVLGDQPLAIIEIASVDESAEAKLDKNVKVENVLSDDMRMITFGIGAAIVSIDSNGELFHGINSAHGVPLRTFFEHHHSLGKYEALRSALLSRLFDAVAPATIVDRVESEVEAETTKTRTSGKQPSANQTAAVINRLMLPRMRYLKTHNAKAIKKDFDTAIEAEAQAQDATPSPVKHGKRLHEVEGFTRLLPNNSKGPGKKAIERAKEYYGEDYELPPGYTFVQTHERGDETLGVVSGYVATKRVVTMEELKE